MYCSKCGIKMKCTAKFCPGCGEKQDVQKNLIMAAIIKDELAYTELFGQAEHTVKLTVYSIMNPNGRNSADADDVIIDSMMKGFASLEQLKDANSFLPWMRTIARNKAVDYLRKNKELNFSELSTDEMSFEDTLEDMDFSKRPDMVMEQNSKSDLLKEILADIPADQRAVIVMYYYNDMKIPEIARELGCTEATVKSRLKYGKSKIKIGVEHLQKKHGIKLYSVSPVLVLYWLFRDTEPSCICGTNILEYVLHNSGVYVAQVQSVTNVIPTSTQAASTTSFATTVNSTVAAKAVTATVAKGISAKIISAIVAVSIVATSGVGYGIYTIINQNIQSTNITNQDNDVKDNTDLEIDRQESNESSSEESSEVSVENSSEASSELNNESSTESSAENSSETSNEASSDVSNEDISTMSTAEQLGLEGEMLGALVFQYENMINGFTTRTQYIKDMNEGFGVTLEQALKITEEEGGVDILYNVDRIETPEEFYVGLAAEVGVEITYNPNKEETDFQDVYYDCCGDPTLKIENLGDGNYRVELSIYRHIGFDAVETQIVDGKLAFSVGWDDGETWNVYLVKTENGSIDAHCKYTGYNYSNKFYEHFVIYHFSKTEDFEGEFCKYIYPVYE